MNFENIMQKIKVFTEALDFQFASSPTRISNELDWESENLPDILGLCHAFAPGADDKDRLFKKIVDTFSTIKNKKLVYFIRGIYTPFSIEEYYKIMAGDISDFDRISSEEFYEEKALHIENERLPVLGREIKAVNENLGLAFISKRSSGDFNDGIEHPYYFYFDLADLIPFKHADSRAMELLKQFLSMLEFKEIRENKVYFSIVKTMSTLDLVRQYVAMITSCKSRTELRDVYYRWNERLSFVQLSFLQEKYLYSLYDATRSTLPPFKATNSNLAQ